MIYKEMYYSLFNSVTDVIDILDKKNGVENIEAINMLKEIQRKAEEKYLILTKNLGEKTVDLKTVKKSNKNKVG